MTPRRLSPRYAGLPGLRSTAHARGLSLATVAARVGCHPSHLSQVAAGRRPIAPLLAARLPAVLSCRWADLQPFYRRPVAAPAPAPVRKEAAPTETTVPRIVSNI